MPNRLLCFVLLSACSLGAYAQSKSLTFDNATPPKTIQLLNGTTVSISTAGNLTAKCVLNGTNCADIGSGTGTNPPTVGLTASGFSQPPDGNNKYPANTTFTLTPSVSNAAVCVRELGAGTPGDSLWSGTQTGSYPASSHSVPTASATYVFQLTCYNSGGSASAQATVSTNAGGGGQGPDCTGITPPAGFTQSSAPTQWAQLMGAAFPVMNPNSATVPHQSGLVFLGASRGNYTSVQFTTPATAPWQHTEADPPYNYSNFTWDDSQIVGAPANGSLPNGALITISRCPGDFRIDIPAQDRVDSTDWPTCKSIRNGSGLLVIQYNQTGVSNVGECGLAPGKTYYLNYINADPTGGITSGEHTCRNNVTTCGVQMRHQ